MTEDTNVVAQAQVAAAEAEAHLDALDSSPFSPSAFSLLKEKIAQHVTELVNESVKVSKRHRADTVSAAHVERASKYLVAFTSRRIYRHLGTVGGILLDAALSNILAMTLAGQYTGGGTILPATLWV